MATIGSLSVKLGLITVDWDKATDKAKKQAKDLQTAFNNLGKELNIVQRAFGSFTSNFNLAGIGIAALTAKAIGLSRDVKDMADSFGLSTAKVLEYRAALETSGVAAENTSKVLATLFGKIDEMQSGKGIDAVEKFNKMGISLSEISKLKPDQALEVFSKGLLKLDSDFERANIKAMFLGKGSKTFGPESFLENLKKVKGGYDSAGDSINRLAQLDDNLQISMQNLTIAFADILGKFIGNDGLVVSVQQFKDIIEVVFSVYTVKAISSFTIAIMELTGAMIALKNATIAFFPGASLLLKFMSAIGSLGTDTPGLADLLKKIAEMRAEVEKPITSTVDVTAANLSKSNLDLENAYYAQYKARLTLAKEELEFQKRSLQIKLDAYNTDEWTTKQRELQLKYEEDIAKLNNEMAQELKSIPEGSARASKIKEIYDVRKQGAKEALDSEVALSEKQKEIQTNFAEGWKNAYAVYMRESEKAGEIGAQAFTNMTKSLEDTLTTFFETGKLNFRSFASSIIHEMARIQAQAAAKSIMGIFGGGGGGIGGFFSSLASSIFGGGAVSTAGVNSSLGNLYIPSLLHSAGGNDIKAGQASIVGENGPEMFMPNQSGKIVSNTNSNQMLGQSQPQIVYNGPYIANMSAIDTQSGLQFLAKNKQGVWAANQSAQRSIPQSR